MHKRYILLIACLALIAHPSFAARTETKPYLIGVAVDTGPLPGGLVNDCTGNGPSSGGTCFALAAADHLVSVSITDDGANPVAGVIQFTDDFVVPNQVGAVVQFCGSVEDVVVPSAAKVMYVVTEMEFTPTPGCPAASSGTITATFS